MSVLGEYKYTKPAVSPAYLLSLHEMRVVVVVVEPHKANRVRRAGWVVQLPLACGV